MRLRVVGTVLALVLVVGACSDDVVDRSATQTTRSKLHPPTTATAGAPVTEGGTTPGTDGTSGSGSTTPQNNGTLDWKRCPGQLGFQCATLEVPLDYGHPDGEQIKLALIRQPARNSKNRIGSLLMNPGGPGGSGIEFLTGFGPAISRTVSDRFDLVSFDPRGVGESDPITCVPDKEKDASFNLDPVPDNQDEINALDQESLRQAKECGAKYGDRLAFYGTISAAKDMDRIRQAVGDDKLTYLGISYGTRLGSVYAQLFPKQVRAMVLDGAVDPDPAAKDFDSLQAQGFENGFAAFAKDCDSRPSCPAGPDVAQLYDRLAAKLETTAVPAKSDSRQLTLGWFTSGVIGGLYAKELWPALAQALHEVDQGDGSRMLRIADLLYERGADGHWSNEGEANSTVNCLDEPNRLDLKGVENEADQLAQVAPRFGRVLAWGNGLPCTYWPVPPDPIPLAKADGAPPILVIGTTRDPVTPLVWAQRMASTLSSGVLLQNDGDGHSAYAQGHCTDEVNNYLVDLTLPAPGSTCAPA